MFIREFTMDDEEKVNIFYNSVDKLHRENYPELFCEVEGKSRGNDYLETFLNSENKKLFIADAEGEIIGFMECYTQTSRNFPLLKKRSWIQIDTLIVDESYRGKGVSQKLLKRAEEWAIKIGISRLELNVFSFNEGAEKFYKKNGFYDLKKTMIKNLNID